MPSTINAQTTPFAAIVQTADNTGNLAFQTANVTAVTIDTSQNVGIGTSSPSTYGKLAVNGSTYIAGAYCLQVTRAIGSQGAIIDSPADSTLAFYNWAGTERMRLDASGNLGLGTSSPTDTNSWGRCLDIRGTSTSGYAGTYFGNSDATVRGYVGAGGASGAGLAFFGTSTSTPLLFYTANSEKMRLDSSGNLGLGVTPSAWNSVYRAIQLPFGASLTGRTDTPETLLASNTYRDSVGFKYFGTGNATSYFQTTGSHIWQIASSGTAGNAITFTQAMTLNASGNLGVGTSSPTLARLQVNQSSNTAGAIYSLAASGQNGDAYVFAIAGVTNGYQITNNGSNNIQHIWSGTGGSERMRITSAGGVAFGGPSNFGSSGQVLQSNGDAAPTWVTASSIGVGQSWTNVGGSRSSGTTYTNSTGRAIQLMVATDNTGNTNYGSGGSAKFFINGSNVGEAFCSNAANVGGLFQAIIPPSSTYQVSASIIRSWWELR
jgi:hypothetical protein